MALPMETVDATRLTDEELVQLILAGERNLFEILMRRYNQRLYRVTRAILRNDGEAEDVTQEAYVRAYQHLNQFAGRASFSTWLTRIAVHEALARVRRAKRKEEIDAMEESRKDSLEGLTSRSATPEQSASSAEARNLLERSIDALPDTYREIFMLREVEEMSTSETAHCLGITEENVKTRLYRARALLRKELYARAGARSTSAFQFMGPRCDRLVKIVMQRLAELPTSASSAN
jgi:RNA polymerase sigma-70 factor (ECF subfamily)